MVDLLSYCQYEICASRQCYNNFIILLELIHFNYSNICVIKHLVFETFKTLIISFK